MRKDDQEFAISARFLADARTWQTNLICVQ